MGRKQLLTGRRVGQPTVVCPKCMKLISPPERLVEHFPRCSGERASVLKRPPFVTLRSLN